MIKAKKGEIEQTIYFVIFEIILIAITALALFSYVNNLAKSTGFEKQILARDFALILDAVYAAPGNLEYAYQNNFSNFNFNMIFGDSLVQISEKDNTYMPAFPYASSFNIYMPAYEANTKEKIVLFKSDNKIEINSEFNSDLFLCPYVNTTKNDWKILLDTNFNYNLINSEKLTGTPKDKREKITLTYSPDIQIINGIPIIPENYQIAKEKTQEVVSFYMGKTDANENPLKIYIVVDSVAIAESRKLACIIINQFMQEAKTKFTSAEIIPVYETSDETDLKYILTKNRVQVFIEAGNTNYKYENIEQEKTNYFILLERVLKDYFGEKEPGQLCNLNHCKPKGIDVCLAYGGLAPYTGCPEGNLCCNNIENECELNKGECVDLIKETCSEENLIDKKCPYSLKCCVKT